MTGRAHRERWFYLCIGPWLVGLITLQVGPGLATVGLAFTDWTPPAAPTVTGLDNLVALTGDARAWRAILNTAVYAVATVIPGLAIGFGIALLLRGLGALATVVRAAIFVPVVLAGVATAVLWGWILNPRSGLVDALLGVVGIDGPAWLSDPAWAMPAIVLIGLWGLGVNVVVYVAALGTVRRDLLEAAALDGAGGAARVRHIIWPALVPVTIYLAVVQGIAAFVVFTPTYVLTGGGPEDATLTTALFTYQVAFGSGRLGYAAAISLVVLGIVIAITLTQLRVVGRRLPTSGGGA